MKDYAKELRSLSKLPAFLLNKFTGIENENKQLTKRYGKRSFTYGILEIANNRVLMYWLIMLLTIGLIYLTGNIEPGNLLIMTVSVGTAALLIGAFVNTIPQMSNISLYYKKLIDFMALSGDRQKDTIADNTGIIITNIKSIRFDHVSFAYPHEKRMVLQDISFEIHKGESLAIVGINGAGKSTILKLILKFYTPNKGNIYINGIDINRIDENSYRKMFGCVFQEVNLYALPVYRNITMSDQAEDKEKLDRAITDSGLSNLFPTNKERRRDMTKELSDQGIVLSGGNAQKVAIARALYHDAAVFLLDEITSAIDPETELEIMQRINQASKDKIVVLVSHKLFCVKNVDKIIVLEDGRVAETGSHLELIREKGKYYTLFKAQSEQFKKEAQEQELEQEAWL